MRLQNDLILENINIMDQNLQKRLEQLINQGGEILRLAAPKKDALGIIVDRLTGDGPEQFNQWKLSCKKVLKRISEEDYNSFISTEKPIGYDCHPNMLKRLIPILKASLDDLNFGIMDSNSFTAKQVPHNINYHISNVGNMANHNENSTINQTSTNTVNVIKGDFNSLASNLRSHGVEETNIQELQTIIDVTPLPQSPSEYSSDLKCWMVKMIGKSIDGTWQIAVGAAGNLLATGLQQYFGILG